MVGGCCVCSDERGWAENPLVYCDGHGCNVAVHQACYGIVQVPTGPWFCRKCESQERAARVKCELCPQKDGALKRTDTGGWAHVVCALFIPEVQFGNVITMEPIILKLLPNEKYHKSCYVCEEQGRESRASTGACMQCNKNGCKQHFHVTCAQAQGLLCEEQGNYMDNVKYCGYCSYHYKKLKKDSHIKTIPAFKPIPAENATPESTPEKLQPMYTKARGKEVKMSKGYPSPQISSTVKVSLTNIVVTTSPSTVTTSISSGSSTPGSDKGGTAGKFTTANFVETTITPSPANIAALVADKNKEKEEKEKPSAKRSERERSSSRPSSVNSNASSSKEKREDKEIEKKEPEIQKEKIRDKTPSRTPPQRINTPPVRNSTPPVRMNTPPVLKKEKEKDKEREKEKEKPRERDTNNMEISSGYESDKDKNKVVSTTDSIAETIAAVAAGPSVSVSHLSSLAEDKYAYKSDSETSTASAVSDNLKDNDSHSDGFSRFGKSLAKTPPLDPPSLSVCTSTTSASFSNKYESFLRNSATLSSAMTGTTNSTSTVPSHTEVTGVKRPRSRSTEKGEKKKARKQQQKQNVKAKTVKELLGSPADPGATSPPISPTSSSKKPEKKKKKVLSPTGVNMSSLYSSSLKNTSPISLSSLQKQGTNSDGTEHFMNGPHSGSLISPTRQASKGLMSPKSMESSMSANQLPTSMEQLLERQWEQGSAFLMEQGQHFDIASLLNCLHQLRQENQRLEEHIATLTARRDHLLAVHARLHLPLTPVSNPTSQQNAGSQGTSPESGNHRSPRVNNLITTEAQPQDISNPMNRSTAPPRSPAHGHSPAQSQAHPQGMHPQGQNPAAVQQARNNNVGGHGMKQESRQRVAANHPHINTTPHPPADVHREQMRYQQQQQPPFSL